MLPTSHKQKSKKKQRKSNRIRRKDITEDYDDRVEDYEDDDYSMPDFGGFFSDMFSSVGNYVPFFQFFSGDGGDENDIDNENIVDEGRSTTPRIELRKPKKPSNKYYKDYFTSSMEEAEKRRRWYNPFFYDSSEEDASTTPLAPTTTESGFLDWIMGSGEEATESPQTSSASDTSNPSKV